MDKSLVIRVSTREQNSEVARMLKEQDDVELHLWHGDAVGAANDLRMEGNGQDAAVHMPVHPIEVEGETDSAVGHSVLVRRKHGVHAHAQALQYR